MNKKAQKTIKKQGNDQVTNSLQPGLAKKWQVWSNAWQNWVNHILLEGFWKVNELSFLISQRSIPWKFYSLRIWVKIRGNDF